MEAGVPPLEAAFIELFAMKGEFRFFFPHECHDETGPVGVPWLVDIVLLSGLVASFPFSIVYPVYAMLTIILFW